MPFYSGHGDGPTVYYRTSDSDNDISSMGSEQSFTTSDDATYPTAKEFASGRIRTFYRSGGTFAYKDSTDNGSSWGSEQSLFDQQYVKVVQDPSNADILHFAVFRHAVFRPDGTADVWHCRYDRSTDAYYQADGTTIGSTSSAPFDALAGDLGAPIYDASESGHNAHGWDMAVDGDGNIGIVYIQFRGPADIRYRSAQWDGSAWTDTELCPAGGRITQEAQPHYVAGCAVKHADPSTVYLSRGGDSSIVQKWETADHGSTWSVTGIYDSDGLNLRPVSVANANDDLEVLLANGRYRYINERGYDTRVLGIDGSSVDNTGQTSGINPVGQKSGIYLGSDDTVAANSTARVPMDSVLMDNYADVDSPINLPDNEIRTKRKEVCKVSGNLSVEFADSGTVSAWVRIPKPNGGAYEVQILDGKEVSTGDVVNKSFSHHAPIRGDGGGGYTYIGIENATGSQVTILSGQGHTSLSLVSDTE